MGEGGEPRWLRRTIVEAIHADLIRLFGGSHGVRDDGLLESALDRPRNRWHYGEDADLATLAAAYGFGLARNHAFVDGNKRIAFQAMYVFLGLNGLGLEADEDDVVITMTGVAAGTVDEDGLVDWLREHTLPRT